MLATAAFCSSNCLPAARRCSNRMVFLATGLLAGGAGGVGIAILVAALSCFSIGSDNSGVATEVTACSVVMAADDTGILSGCVEMGCAAIAAAALFSVLCPLVELLAIRLGCP